MRNIFPSRWIKQFFGKTIKNLRKHRNIKIATTTTKRRRYYLISELNYHTTKIFTENLLVIEMTKKWILLDKPLYFEFSMLDLSKTVLYEVYCWYDEVKAKYDENVKMFYVDTDSFII